MPASWGRGSGPVVSKGCNSRGQSGRHAQDVTLDVAPLCDPGDSQIGSISGPNCADERLSTIHRTYCDYYQEFM
jgi:hypothetical protein